MTPGTAAGRSRLIVVAGLQREADIARGAGVQVIVAGAADRTRSGSLLEKAIAAGADGIISFGVAGGLDPQLQAGACLIGRRIVVENERLAADPAWVDRLAKALPAAIVADLAGVDRPVTDPAIKHRLHGTTGAAAVDMETHIAARLAAAHRLPFAALRVICDPAERRLPPAALAGFQADGRIDVAAVLRSLLAGPSQLPDLIRLARDSRIAFNQLRRTRRALGAAFGFPGRGNPSSIRARRGGSHDPGNTLR